MRCPNCGREMERAHCVVVLPGRGWRVVPARRCPACRARVPESQGKERAAEAAKAAGKEGGGA